MLPLKKRLESRLSKAEIEQVTVDIITGSVSLKDVREVLADESGAYLFNIFWVVSTVAIQSPDVLNELANDIFRAGVKHSGNDTVVRCCMSVFRSVKIPVEIEDELYDFSFRLLQSSTSSIAQKSFSMTVCCRIAEKYPELKKELAEAIILASELYGVDSPGIRSASLRILSRLTLH